MRPPCWEATVEAKRSGNVRSRDGIREEEFAKMCETRDTTLSMPRLLLPSGQANLRAGFMPPPESYGVSHLKLPVNAL